MTNFQFHNLAGSPGKSCNVIRFRDTFVMMDCTLDFMSTLTYLPLSLVHSQHLSSLPNWVLPKDKIKSAQFTPKEARSIIYEAKECQSGYHCIDSTPEFSLFNTDKIDVNRIDVVLITNYLNMFGLPYLTERMDFKGVVYVTEPTYHYGKIMMEEVIKLIERTPRPGRKNLWKRIHNQVNICIPRNHAMDRNPNNWLKIFTSEELSSCLSKLKIVNFSQSIDIFGLFEVSAHSSGFCIGSCNWTLKSNHEKITYMSQTSLLTTHPKPFEQTPLLDSDVLILTNLTPSPLVNPDNMLGDFCSQTIQTLKNGGNVLIPCYPCGMVYDMIECIAGQLTAANLMQVPIFFVSPVADASLAYANILGEWLTSTRQCKVFVPDEPFIHSSLVRAERLRHFPSVSDSGFSEAFKCPCVVFTSHPSLRFGDVVHFIQLWGQSSKNLLILTEPDFLYQETVSPYLPMQMRLLYIPIDTNYNYRQANNLLSESLKPRNLILHSSYVTKPPANFYSVHGFSTTDLMIELHTSITNKSDAMQLVEAGSSNSTALCKTTELLPYSFNGTIDLSNMSQPYERMKVDSDFAKRIIQSEIRPGVSFATINGLLEARDNKYILKSIDDTTLARFSHAGSFLPPKHYYYGHLNFQALMRLLQESGVNDAVVENAKGGMIVEIRSLKAIIHVEDSQTHIVAAESKTRERIRNLVQACLPSF